MLIREHVLSIIPSFGAKPGGGLEIGKPGGNKTGQGRQVSQYRMHAQTLRHHCLHLTWPPMRKMQYYSRIITTTTIIIIIIYGGFASLQRRSAVSQLACLSGVCGFISLFRLLGLLCLCTAM